MSEGRRDQDELDALRLQVHALQAETARLQEAARRAAEAQALQQTEDPFRLFFDNAPMAKSMTAPDGRLLRVNQALCAMLGYSSAELQAGSWATITHPDDVAATRAMVRGVLAGERSTWVLDKRFLAKDGHIVWARLTTSLQRAPAGEPLFFLTHIQDISERKRAEAEISRLNAGLEERVAERTRQLEAANRELEAFSYSVSHDLRAPLRAIDGFARILADDFGPLLNDEGQRVCAVIRENTAKMGQLIDDLLAFSRLGRAAIEPSRIDMGGMARAVFYELTTPESRRRIDFTLGALPTAIGDPSLMRQVWANLLGNALKFTARRERAVITVSAEAKADEDVFAVSDNGAGFDMKYASKLFGVFQRLHSEKEFEGTGVGLALVQRVIQRHAGRVWAQGEPGKGATFWFAVPQRA